MNESYKADMSLIEQLHTSFSGIVISNDEKIEAELKFLNGNFSLAVNKILDIGVSEYLFPFHTDELQIAIRVSLTQHNNSVNSKDNQVSRYSEGFISSFNGNVWSPSPAFYRSYYLTEWRFLYDICGNPNSLHLFVDKTLTHLHRIGEYLVLENDSQISYDKFSELSYNILVALGFVSGKFTQEEVYTFRRSEKDSKESDAYKYKKLRRGYSSIYHAVTGNAHSYNHRIGADFAEKIDKEKTLKHLDSKSLSVLSDLVHKQNQIQYALMLFIEANSKGSSLLIMNNCFFVVLEVLKKYFHDTFKTKLPKNYSQQGNIEKFKLVFDMLFPVNDEELDMIKKRNIFMHGDIKELEGEEMFAIMLKQLTFIYKAVLSFVGFDGCIIDHYAIRNNLPEKSFIRIN